MRYYTEQHHLFVLIHDMHKSEVHARKKTADGTDRQLTARRTILTVDSSSRL